MFRDLFRQFTTKTRPDKGHVFLRVLHLLIIYKKLILNFFNNCLCLFKQKDHLKYLRGRNVIIYCGNMAVVSTLTSGRSWDEFLGTIARNVWLITASYDIELSILHVPGKDNDRADSLSRWFGGGLSTEVVNDLLSLQWCNVSNEILRLN